MAERTMKPHLELRRDLSIGYREPLAEVKDTTNIMLESGTHYLLARNGRGKTTLLRTLAGVMKPVSGVFKSHGVCQFLSEDLTFDRELSASHIFKSLLGKKESAEALALAAKLELDVNQIYGKLSTGNKRKVALLVAEFSISHDQGNILLLDEPFTGLDAFAREVFQDLWKEPNDKVLRLVSCHPDFDSMEMESSVLISEGEITHLRGGDVPKQWGELKTKLN